MYIDFKNFKGWLNKVNFMKEGISPGGFARKWNVSRQTINNWINDDVIDAYRYDGKEGAFVIIDAEESNKRVKDYKGL